MRSSCTLQSSIALAFVLSSAAGAHVLVADDHAEFDIAVRTVDIERVTPLGPCR